MAIKRPSCPEGRIVVLEHVSRVLAGNPLGDPHVRKLHVWLPPQYDASSAKRFPVLFDLAGYTGSGPAHLAWRAFDEFNVERLRRYVRRPIHLGGDSAEPPPEVGADGALEHVVAEILRFRLRAGRPQLLVRWEGKDASGDTWEPLENLTNCEQAIRDFELAQGVVVPRPLPPPTSQACGGSSPPLPPAGFVVDPSPGDPWS